MKVRFLKWRCLFLLWLITGLFYFQCTGFLLAQKEDVRVIFEKEYGAWIKYCRNHKITIKSDFPVYFKFQKSEYCRRIVELGIPSLPIVIEKVEEEIQKNDSSVLYVVLHKITKANLHVEKKEKQPGEFVYNFSEFPDIEEGETFNVIPKLWLHWWKEGRKQTPQKFNELYEEWQNLKTQGKDEEAKDKYQRIKDLGVVALPCIMEKIEQGETDLVPIASYLTDGSVSEKAGPAECIDWWKKNKEEWIIPE